MSVSKPDEKKNPGPTADRLRIDIDPEEAVHRLLTAPPEKKGRSASAKSANEEDPTKD